MNCFVLLTAICFPPKWTVVLCNKISKVIKGYFGFIYVVLRRDNNSIQTVFLRNCIIVPFWGFSCYKAHSFHFHFEKNKFKWKKRKANPSSRLKHIIKNNNKTWLNYSFYWQLYLVYLALDDRKLFSMLLSIWSSKFLQVFVLLGLKSFYLLISSCFLKVTLN